MAWQEQHVFGLQCTVQSGTTAFQSPISMDSLFTFPTWYFSFDVSLLHSLNYDPITCEMGHENIYHFSHPPSR